MSTESQTPDLQPGDMPFLDHLRELRTRLVRVVISWLICFCFTYYFAEDIYIFLAEPARQALEEGSSFIFLKATEPFFTVLKTGALAAVLVSLPVIFWQIWGFIAPGLYGHEKRMAIPFVFFSCLCFACGGYFGYTFVFPTIFEFLINYGTSLTGVKAQLSIGEYLSLAVRLLFAFGMVFELPVIIFFLARLGVVDYKWLAAKRKFALLAAFLFGAMLTPPDVISQMSLALPFIILYEVGIIVARLFGKKKEEDAEGENDTEEVGKETSLETSDES